MYCIYIAALCPTSEEHCREEEFSWVTEMFPGSNRCDQQRFDTSIITGSLWKKEKKNPEGWSWTRARGASSFPLSGVNYSTNQLPPPPSPPSPPSSDGQQPHDPHSTASHWFFFFFLHLTGFHRATVWLPGCSLGGVWLLLTGLLSFELMGGKTDKICQSSLFLLMDNSHAWFVLFFCLFYCYHPESRRSGIPVVSPQLSAFISGLLLW